jgi:hypothetical protein
MTDVLSRGLSAAAVARIDADATALGLSRNEFLRRQLERDLPTSARVSISASDWTRSAATFDDLGDPDIMAAAWR